MLGGLRPLGGACARDGIPNTSTSGSGSSPLCCELTTTAGALLFGSCETMTERKAFPAATARRAVSHSLSCPIFETLPGKASCWRMFYRSRIILKVRELHRTKASK